jgi:hypothetical protein
VNVHFFHLTLITKYAENVRKKGGEILKSSLYGDVLFLNFDTLSAVILLLIGLRRSPQTS